LLKTVLGTGRADLEKGFLSRSSEKKEKTTSQATKGGNLASGESRWNGRKENGANPLCSSRDSLMNKKNAAVVPPGREKIKKNIKGNRGK